MQLRGLIFDLDGTLLDSAADLSQAINTTLEHHGRKPLSVSAVRAITGDGMLSMINRAFASTGSSLPPDQTDAVFNEFLAHYASLTPDRGQLYPHVIETLDFYRNNEIKLGLCTNKQEQATLRLVNDLELNDYFSFVAGGDTFPVRKPHAGHVRGVFEALGLTSKEVAMIGDSANDIISSKGAGVKCIAITHGKSSSMSDDGDHGIITHFRELPAALTKMGFEITNPQ